MRDRVREIAEEARELVDWLASSEDVHARVETIAVGLAACLRAGGRILTCGNGGSMCDAMHFAEELTGRFHADRPALSAMSISDPSHLTCTANDFGFEQVFARGVEAWGREGDVLVTFTTSGNSPNILAAAEAARAKGMRVVGLLGGDGGKMTALCDHHIVVPARRSDRVQEIHIKLVHTLIELVERQLHPENYEETP